jgi:hypothetical protein
MTQHTSESEELSDIVFTTKLRYGFFPLLELPHCFHTASSTPSCGLLRTFRAVFLVHFCFTHFNGFQRLNCLFNCQFEGSAWACMLSSAHLVAQSAVKSGGCLSSTTRLHQRTLGKPRTFQLVLCQKGRLSPRDAQRVLPHR